MGKFEWTTLYVYHMELPALIQSSALFILHFVKVLGLGEFCINRLFSKIALLIMYVKRSKSLSGAALFLVVNIKCVS